MWDDGSYDSEFDPQTGNVLSCQKAGGTWVELGQNGNWSASPNGSLSGLVTGIQNGSVPGVLSQGPNGTYLTTYASTGQVITDVTPNGATTYSYVQAQAPRSQPSVPRLLIGRTATCVTLEPCGAVEGTGAVGAALIFGATVATVVTYRYFAKKRDTKQANDAWREIQRRCASKGKQLNDDHREQWHEAITGQGLDYNDLIQIGVEMFCPGAASD